MDKENAIVYVDLSRPSSIMSNVTYNQGRKFNAFTERQVDRTPFVSMYALEKELGLKALTDVMLKIGGKID